MSSCVKALCFYKHHYLAKEYHKENVEIACIVCCCCFPSFKQLQRVVTMVLKSLYSVCLIKTGPYFSSFSVEVKYSYKNSIVLGSSPFVLKHITVYWRASVASEHIRLDNAKSGICYGERA